VANEILASLDDINTHLPDDKAKMADSDDNSLQIDVARYVRSLLSGFFSASVLSSWVSPATTPDIIRGIAGKLIAAKWYAILYSEDIETANMYAQNLYNEANMMIDGVRTGVVVVLDVNNVPIPAEGVASLTSDDFYPNDAAPAAKFTMDKVFS
jgi:hypothetical protein